MLTLAGHSRHWQWWIGRGRERGSASGYELAVSEDLRFHTPFAVIAQLAAVGVMVLSAKLPEQFARTWHARRRRLFERFIEGFVVHKPCHLVSVPNIPQCRCRKSRTHRRVAPHFCCDLHDSSCGSDHAFPIRMSDVDIENVAWVDNSGLCCVVTSQPSAIGHHIRLVAKDGRLLMFSSVQSVADASRLTMEWRQHYFNCVGSAA
jgi:hypothetical protein